MTWIIDPDDRTTFYGGTCVARLLGVSPYGGPIDVYLEKREKVVRPPSPRAEWGQRLEAAICAGYAATTGYKLRRIRHVRRRDAPLVIIHPDRIVLHEPGIMDGKATEQGDAYGEPGSSDVPPWVRVQMVMYLGHMRREWADVFVMTGATRGPVPFRVLPDQELYEAGLEEADRFHHDHVLPGVPPPADGSEAWREWIRARYQADDGVEMPPATAEQMLLVDDLRDAVALFRTAETRLELAKQRIWDVMGPRVAMPTRYGRITYKNIAPSPRWKEIADAVATEAGIALEPFVTADKAGRRGPRMFLHPFTAEEA